MRLIFPGKLCLAVPVVAFALTGGAPGAMAAAAPTTTTLAVTAGGSAVTTVLSGTAITLMATVRAGGAPVTQGLVDFCDAAAAHCTDIHLLGQAQVTAVGTATLNLRPGQGRHIYKAVFLANAASASSSATAGALTVTAPSVDPSNSNLTVTGNTGSYKLTATVIGNGPVAPPGTISFLDSNHGNAVVGTAALTPAVSGFNFATATYPFGASSGYPTTVLTADLNHDGIPDLLAVEDDELVLLLGNGDGTFKQSASFPLDGLYHSVIAAVAVSDFNGDGIPDVAMTVYSFVDDGFVPGYVEIFLGNGDGTFSKTGADSATGYAPYGSAVGDFNGDGISDIAVPNLDGALTVLMGRGDGTFNVTTGNAALYNSGAEGATAAQFFPGAVATGDFNGDGILDLAVVSQPSEKVYVLLGKGDGTFAAAASPATGHAPANIVAADFNGDGIPDLAVGNGSASAATSDNLTILLGNGDGTFTAAASNPALTFTGGLAVADINGDGIADLVAGSGTSAMVYLGAGDGTFTLGTSASIAAPQSIAVADFNADGVMDIVAGSASSLAVLLTEKQSATATASSVTVAPPGSGAHAIVASYPGDTSYAASVSAPATLNAVQGTPAVKLTASTAAAVTYGAPVTFTATVTGGGLSPTGLAQFYDGSTYLGAGNLSSGVYASVITTLAPGTHAVTTHYLGDANYLAAVSFPVSVTVDAGATATVALASSSNSVAYGTQVTLTATLSGAGALPTGRVSFLDGTTNIGTATLSTSGVAAFATETLGVGPHSITAMYTGDGNYAAANSSSVSVAVNLDTASLSLTSSSGAVVAGSPVIFSVTAIGNAGTPTGGVIFLDGAQQIGSGALNSSGVASLATSALPVGLNSMTVNYAGNSAYAAVTSAATAVSVTTPANASSTSLTIQAGGAPAGSVSAGTVVTLTAAVLVGSTPATQGLVSFCNAAAPCEDGHVVGVAQLTRAGTAALRFRPGIGTHSYQAEFAGSKNYTSSASPSASPASPLTVTDSGSYPSFSGVAEAGTVGSYTLTATVGGAGPLAPTGKVSFTDTSDGNLVLYTAELGPDMGPAFRDEAALQVGASPTGVIAGDFNGDGLMDIAALNQTDPGTVTVLLSSPGGTFTPASVVTVGVAPVAMVASDFNGDGNLDIAVLNQGQGARTISMLLGNGDGTFTTSTISLPAISINGFMVAGDLNGDGIPDLAVLMTDYNAVPSSTSVEVLLGKGDGTFTLLPLSPGVGLGITQVSLADFNGDRIPDLALLVPGAPGTSDPVRVVLLLGNGDGTFTVAPAAPALEPSPNGYSAMAEADFNGDGIPDLAVSNTDQTCILQVLLGNGDGTFALGSSAPAACSIQSMAVADFSGDGIPDLAQMTPHSGIQILVGNGDGTFTEGAATPSAIDGVPDAVAVADFSGDGTSDLALVYAQTGQARIMLASPHTATATVAGVAIKPAGSGAHLVQTSFPGDGTYAASTSPTVTLTAEQGTPAVNLTVSLNPAAYGASVTLTATAAGSGVVPSGTIAFYDGATALILVPVNSSGIATYTSTTFSVGAHSITATYSGDANYNTATSKASTLTIQMVTGVATVSIMPASSSITTQQALNVAVTVSASAGAPTPSGTVTLASGSFTSAVATLSGGTTSFGIPAGTLKPGANVLTVVYSGSATYASASGTAAVTVTIPRITPVVTVTPASATIVTLPITTLQSLNVAIAVSGGAGAPAATGTVTLSGGSYVSPAAALAGGAASITIPAGALAAGTDPITAAYTPDTAGAASYTGATSTAQVFVIKAAPTVGVTPAAASVTTVQNLKVTVAVSGGVPGTPTPTGTLILSSGSYASAAATLAGGGATITIPAATLAAGSDTLTAVYTPDAAGSLIYTGFSGTAAVAVSLAASSTTATPSASAITTAQGVNVTVAVNGGGNPTPTGTVTLVSGSYSSASTTLTSGSATISIPAGTLPIGADAITAAYAGSAIYLASSASTTVTVSAAIGTATPTVTVTPTSLFITNQQTDAIAISVSGASGQPTGAIVLSSGNYSAQHALAGGAASVVIPAGALLAGPDTLTASYSGDATYAAGSGTAVVTVSELVSNGSGSTTIAAGGAATPSVTIAAGTTYAGTLELACKLTGSPVGAVSLPTCSLNPTSLTLTAGGNGTTTLTIATTAASSSALVVPARTNLWRLGGGQALLAMLLMCGIPARRRRLGSMLALLWVVAVGFTIGCGGNGGSVNSGNNGQLTPATTAGTYAFTVTGADASNPAVSTSTTVSVTVK